MKELWPGWDTVEEIGVGGFGRVYKIRKRGEEAGEYFSALKEINIPTSEEQYREYLDEGYDDKTVTEIFKSQVDRIVDEFRLMSHFRGNSNIVSYEDHLIIPHENGKGWTVLIRMELLTSLIKHSSVNTMTVYEIIKLGIDICRALELCNKKNIIHRDIKPQNIFVNEFGDYKLGDFGIAKTMDHTTHATKTGTYSYMAPEVYRGDAYNESIDIYSLGLVMYWLLNEKRTPFLPLPPVSPTVTQISESWAKRMAGDQIPAPKNGIKELNEVVLKACAYDPEKRYSSPAEMRKDLERVKFAVNPVYHATVTGGTSDGDDESVTVSLFNRKPVIEGSSKNDDMSTTVALEHSENDDCDQLITENAKKENKL